MKFKGFELPIKSLKNESLLRKFAVSFVFMSLVPIVLLLYLIRLLNIGALIEQELPYFSVTIELVVLLAVISFFLIRRSMKSLLDFTKHANEISRGKFNERVAVTERDEIGQLAESFNRITGELEAKIDELQESKSLLQNILQRIGTAVSSSKGIENLLELILETVVKGTESKAGAIFLLTADEKDFELKISYGLGDKFKGFKLNESEGLLRRVITIKKTEAVAGAKTNISAHSEVKIGLVETSIMATPLARKGKVIGIIAICDKQSGDSFISDDIILLENVAAQTAVAIENFKLNKDIEETYLETITALAIAVEAKDKYSKGHLDRVSEYTEKLGLHMQLDDEMMRVLRNGAVLHDIGKIGIRDDVLKKEGPLTPEERKEMETHAVIGVNIIKPIRSMSALCDLVRYHHEFYDGTGYPDGLKGEEIPLCARILKVADAYDAMTSDRAYRKALPKQIAVGELKKKSGIEFDPEIVKKFLEIV
ncbi:MAG: HD domain-containing phosphohydrolase [Candidatus Omnitrophota bacterium]